MNNYYKPKKEEIRSVLKLDFEKRLKYFRNVVGDKCQICLYCDSDGNLLVGVDSEQRKYLYAWPAKEYVEVLMKEKKLGGFSSTEDLKVMDIHDFLDEYIDELIEMDVKIMIFPTEHGGALMTAESFKNMMIEELLKYEDYE